MTLRVGIDLVSVDQVRESIATHGDRYLSRVFTASELRDSGAAPHRLAARFAAKEATVKALGCGFEQIGWQSISVVRDADGRPAIQLTGEVAELAQRQGMQSLAVSLTHEHDHAAAVVIMEADS